MPRGGARPNTGGRRKGAGDKKAAAKWSEQFKKGLWKAMRAKAKEDGRNIHEVMVDAYYSEDTQDAVRLGIYKALQAAFVIPESHKSIEEHKYTHGPVILPEMRPDPAQEDDVH